MAPQTNIPVAANVLGTIGTVFWCIQLVPQIWYNWKQKKTDGLPGLMMFIWATSAVPFGVYAIVQNFNIPIQIQPQIFCALSLTSWTQILIYNKYASIPDFGPSHLLTLYFSGYRVWTATLLSTAIAVVFGGIQALLILTLRGPYNDGVEWPMILVGVIAAILLAAGLVPPYFEIAKRSGRIVGINFVFLAIDWLGAFFSLMALGGVMYIVWHVALTPFSSLSPASPLPEFRSLLLELGIFTSQLLFLLRTRSLRRKAKTAGIPFDELPEARKFVFPRPPLPEDDAEAGVKAEGAKRERRGSTVGKWASRE
ncbi:MAG: hypothetical protein Q9214_001387 [Letrouitia sp. 1 TL-2023]